MIYLIQSQVKKVKKDYNLKIQKMSELKANSYDIIILAVSHNQFIRKLKFMKNFTKIRTKKFLLMLKIITVLKN